MSVCDRVDTVDWLGAGIDCVGDTGFGVLGSAIPSTGDNGPGYTYDDISLPADANVEICGRVTVEPQYGTLDRTEDTAFKYTRTAAGDGADSFTYQLYKNGIASGSPIVVPLQVGAVNGTASGATLTGAGSISGGAASASGGGNATAPGASLNGTSSLSPGSASGTRNSSASGANITGSGSISGGSASGTSAPSDGSASGATLDGGGSISGGAASSAVPPLPVNPAMFYARPGIGWNFPDMIAGDIDTLSFEFKTVLPPGVTIVSVEPHMVVHAGIDPDPDSVVVAGPTLDGSIVSMQVNPTLAGVAYWPRATATLSDGEKVTLPLHGEGSLSVDL